MNKTIYESYCDYCPQVEENIEIEVKFSYIPILGDTLPQYKKLSFDCPIWNCELNGSLSCPLFSQIPVTRT